jgi:hypothetical protein
MMKPWDLVRSRTPTHHEGRVVEVDGADQQVKVLWHDQTNIEDAEWVGFHDIEKVKE